MTPTSPRRLQRAARAVVGLVERPSVSTALVVLALALTALAGVNHGAVRVLLFVGAGVAAGVRELTAAQRKRWDAADKVARDARSEAVLQAAVVAEQQRRLTAWVVLRGIADLVTRLVSAPPEARERPLGRVIQGVLEAAERLSGPDGCRACYYEVEGRRPARRLVLEGDVPAPGRASPVRSFDESSPRGRAVLQEMDSGHTRVETDTSEVAGVLGWGDEVDYRSFISAPIAAGGHLYGMLTVDAPSVDAFRDVDLVLVETLARQLAAAHELRRHEVGRTVDGEGRQS